MSMYGNVALIASKLISTKKISNPVDAWERAVSEVYPESESLRKKSCPKSTFLGLCEEGYLKGVPKGNYTRSIANKNYALKAISFLKENPSLATDESTLWKLILNGQDKEPNCQLETIISLWNEKLIKI